MTTATGPSKPAAAAKSLYVQVLLGVAAGVAVGVFRPGWAEDLKPLGDVFIRLVKMCIAPIVFATVAGGIASVGDLKRVGRIGVKALVYFEALTTLALVLGLVVVHVVRPGDGLHVDVASLDAKGLPAAAAKAPEAALWKEVVPDSVVGAFARGEVLGVLLFAVLFGVALSQLGERGAPLRNGLHLAQDALFKVIGLVMRVAPIGAFGAMAFTVGKHGTGALLSLGKLMACFYVTGLLFVMLVLGALLRLVRVPVWGFFRYLRDELVLVLGTSSSESALPKLIEKLERAGCSKDVVGLVVPTGYSFNLDGTAIYLTMAAVFVAQATDTELTLGQEVGLLVVLLLTSKGAAAVTGGGFVTLAATLASTGTVPVAGLALLLGIDRFMSEARALVNLVGNAVATFVIARWEGALDDEKLREALGDEPPAGQDVVS